MSPAPPVTMAVPLVANRALALSAGVALSEVRFAGAVLDEADPSLSCIDGGARNLSSERGTDILASCLLVSRGQWLVDNVAAA